jgi:predicted Zn-dependent protease
MRWLGFVFVSLAPLAVSAQPMKAATVARYAAVAELYLDNGRYDDAIRIYDDLRAHRAADPKRELLAGLAVACAQSEACKPRRLAVLDEACRALPHRVDLAELYVSELERVGQPDTVLTERKTAAETETQPVTLRDYAEALVARGARALPDMRTLQRAHPDDAQVSILAAELFERTSSFAELDAVLAELTHRHPKDPEGWVRLGRRALDRDDIDGAARAAARADTLHPTGETASDFASLRRDIERVRHERRQNFLDDTRWTDLVDDLARVRND